MEYSKTFQDLRVWQLAHEFVLSVYRVSSTFPEYEKFGLCSQFTRAAVSVPANIAEGYKKLGKADKLRFLNQAQGSLEECRYYVILSRDLSYISEEQYNDLYSKVETVSWYLNAYAKGIVNNNALKDNISNVH
ncbi:MAG: four helix bundle protein [Prevotella sp.]|nr:four helix bundle protein [Prevotella sp.]